MIEAKIEENRSAAVGSGRRELMRDRDSMDIFDCQQPSHFMMLCLYCGCKSSSRRFCPGWSSLLCSWSCSCQLFALMVVLVLIKKI
eukprot:scaffold439_cov121-Skeletonema_dohrnii-CCMP3373.AAC.3